MTDSLEHREPRRRFAFGRTRLALAGAGLLGLGAVAGAGVMAATGPTVSMAPATPVAIRTLASTGIVTVRGRVAEIYGNNFVLADGTGRALIDAGPEGEDRPLVAPNDLVTVQGRFERGMIHAAFLVGADNKVQALGPLAGPPREPHGPRPGPGHGPDRGPDVPPPPPPPAPGQAGAPAAPAAAPAMPADEHPAR